MNHLIRKTTLHLGRFMVAIEKLNICGFATVMQASGVTKDDILNHDEREFQYLKHRKARFVGVLYSLGLIPFYDFYDPPPENVKRRIRLLKWENK